MPVQTLDFISFLPSTCDEKDFQDLLDLQALGFKERNPKDPLPPQALMRKNLEMMERNPFDTIECYLARDEAGKLVGSLLVGFPKPDNPEYESQKHVAFSDVFVHPEERRKGFGKQLLKRLLEIAKEKQASIIQVNCTSDAGRAFGTQFGATVGIEARTSRVYMNEIDWGMIADWKREGEERNPTTSLELIQGLPAEKDLEDYSRLFTEVVNQQPVGELEGMDNSFTPEKMRELFAQREEMGSLEFTMISREADGSITGLTELSYNPQRPQIVHQGLTGVQMQARGRGLGKWLKAALLLDFREKYPDVEHISTTNATVNEAMLSINNRMGFKLHLHNTMFKLAVDDAMKHFS